MSCTRQNLQRQILIVVQKLSEFTSFIQHTKISFLFITSNSTIRCYFHCGKKLLFSQSLFSISGQLANIQACAFPIAKDAILKKNEHFYRP